jgi:competence protein ComEC
VAVGLGIADYFAADREPLLWGPAAALVPFGTSAFAIGRPVTRSVLVALCAAIAGIAAGQWRTERVLVPSLDRVSIAKLLGFIASVEPRTGDMRLVMLVTAFGTLDSAQRPHRVRITLRQGTVRSGEHITLTARLMPPPAPATPSSAVLARSAPGWARANAHRCHGPHRSVSGSMRPSTKRAMP